MIHGIALDQVRAAATERNSMRAEFSLAESDFVIGTIANFRRQKDYPNVLNAAAILRSKGVTFRWLFVGQGPLESEARGTLHGSRTR